MNSARPNLDELRIDRRDAPRAKGVWKIPAFVIGLCIIALLIWAWKKPGPVAVRTVIAREAGVSAPQRTVLNASGYVTARREATVSSKVTGKVVEVLIEEGKKVQEGEVLARLDDTNIKAGLLLAQAQLVSARKAMEETRVRITEAEQELKRVAALVAQKIATQSDLDHAEASALSLKARLVQQEADVTVAERQVASWEQQLDDTIIRAPFSGVVTSKNAQPGEMISPVSAGGGFTRTGICTIVDMASLEIEIDVNESYINRVEAGQPVEATLDAYPDWKIPCNVIAIIPTADRQKSTVKVRVGFDKLDRRILPEMSVKVAFHESNTTNNATARMIVLPKAAVQQQDGKDMVLVVQNGRVEKRAVTVSNTRDDEVILSAGVAAGEKVAADWLPGLHDGAAVREGANR